MPCLVQLTEEAMQDLTDIAKYLKSREGVQRATIVLGKIRGAIDDLTEFPERGVVPKELAELGIREFREVFFKPYRVIYETADAVVFVHLIADGRRDMRTLLQRRLLSS